MGGLIAAAAGGGGAGIAAGVIGGALLGGLVGNYLDDRDKKMAADSANVNALFIDFDKADTDKDGSLTFEEIEVYSRTTGR